PMLRGRVSDRLQRHPGGPLPQLLAVLPRCCHNSSSFLESEPASDPGRNRVMTLCSSRVKERPDTSTAPTPACWAIRTARASPSECEQRGAQQGGQNRCGGSRHRSMVGPVSTLSGDDTAC